MRTRSPASPLPPSLNLPSDSDKTIVRMGSDDLFVHSAALGRLAAQLTPLRGSLIDVARFKQLTGLSRKYAIPLLEYLDRQRITLKQNDQRLIL